MRLHEPGTIYTLVTHRSWPTEETYCWLYTEDTISECVKSIGRQASDPELVLNWREAAALIKQVQFRHRKTSDGDMLP